MATLAFMGQVDRFVEKPWFSTFVLDASDLIDPHQLPGLWQLVS
ncbi:MAG TPA: hypothetical protein VJZ78_07810 [Anaerolineales bacterium]|nr:hypothetical protein [Anaerolineales bacterium]